MYLYSILNPLNSTQCLAGITLDKIFGPLRAADRAAAGGGGSVVQPAVKTARSYAISSKVTDDYQPVYLINMTLSILLSPFHHTYPPSQSYHYHVHPLYNNLLIHLARSFLVSPFLVWSSWYDSITQQ